MFSQHKFSPVFRGVPSIVIKEIAYRKMARLVQLVDMEVGWLGTVTCDKDTFIIEDIFIPRQECHAATTELTAEGMGALYQELIEADTAAGRDPMSTVGRLRFWGH